MGINLQKPVSKIQQFLSDYTIIQSLPIYNLTYLQQSLEIGKRQLLLKQYPFDTYTDAYQFSLTLEDRSHRYKQCSYLVSLQKYLIVDNQEQGREGNSVYGLYDFSHRTLDHERLDRMIKDIKFNENQIWSIAMSCVSALSFFQNSKVRHLNLSSSTITLDDEGVIRLYDPELIKNSSNYYQIVGKKSVSNVYICPELCQSLALKIKNPQIDPYLSDVFVMGMILLEIGLMQYVNECYSDNYEVFHYQVLQQKIDRFSELYSEDLTIIVRQMVKPVHLRCSFRRVSYLIKKFQPPQSKYSSYRQLSKPFETPVRSRVKETSRSSIQFQDDLKGNTHRSQKIFELPAIKGVTFADSDIKEKIKTKRGKSQIK